VMQHVPSDYDTDLFTPIIERAVEVIGKKYERGAGGASYRVLADHARAVAFLLADGVYPSNEGRGYVLRRILRRAVRHAWLLGRREPPRVHLVRTVEARVGGGAPRPAANAADRESGAVQAARHRRVPDGSDTADRGGAGPGGGHRRVRAGARGTTQAVTRRVGDAEKGTLPKRPSEAPRRVAHREAQEEAKVGRLRD